MLKSNKGLESRLEADLRTTKRKTESIMVNLERKAKMYDQLGRGLTGGLTEDQITASALDASADLRCVTPTNSHSGRPNGGEDIQ